MTVSLTDEQTKEVVEIAQKSHFEPKAILRMLITKGIQELKEAKEICLKPNEKEVKK